jgi:hypothetical protein
MALNPTRDSYLSSHLTYGASNLPKGNIRQIYGVPPRPREQRASFGDQSIEIRRRLVRCLALVLDACITAGSPTSIY